MKVNIKKLHKNAVIPKYAKAGDAGLDITATSYEYKDGRHVYGTGLAFEIPEGYVGLLFPRSSICKQDLILTNSVGVLDSGYRGEVKFIFDSHAFPSAIHEDTAAFKRRYSVGDRIGQILILPYPQIEFIEADELGSTERGTGGFGSSGL